MKCALVLFISLTLAAIATISSADLYKWQDENGVWHFSNSKPEDVESFETQDEWKSESPPQDADGEEQVYEATRIDPETGDEIARHLDLNARIPDVPQYILKDIIDKAKEDWPDNHVIQELAIREQARAYLAIQEYWDSHTPTRVLMRIKKKAAQDWPNDYVMQESMIKEQTGAHSRVDSIIRRN